MDSADTVSTAGHYVVAGFSPRSLSKKLRKSLPPARRSSGRVFTEANFLARRFADNSALVGALVGFYCPECRSLSN